MENSGCLILFPHDHKNNIFFTFINNADSLERIDQGFQVRVRPLGLPWQSPHAAPAVGTGGAVGNTKSDCTREITTPVPLGCP